MDFLCPIKLLSFLPNCASVEQSEELTRTHRQVERRKKRVEEKKKGKKKPIEDGGVERLECERRRKKMSNESIKA